MHPVFSQFLSPKKSIGYNRAITFDVFDYQPVWPYAADTGEYEFRDPFRL